MTRWRLWAEWEDDDPALVRMREALALEAPAEAPPEPAPDPVPPMPERLDPEVKRSRIAELLARIQAGDLSASEMLRRLLDNR